MPTRLTLYNGALRAIGHRALVSLSEGVEARRVLDEVYDDCLAYCLEQGLWNWAIRTLEIGANPSVSPAFGYTYAFDRPDDWVRTVEISADDTFNDPLTRITDEASMWHASVDPIFVRYVSNAVDAGMDMSRWPATFTKAVETWLAHEICERITKSGTKLAEINKLWRMRIADARSKDAMNEAARFPPTGSWVRSRWGRGGTRRRGGLEQ